MLAKLAAAQLLLRRLHEKQAGTMLPLAIGAGALGAAHVIGKGAQKAQEYKAGFQPGVNPHGGHQ